jgi:hypothetical protein
MIFFIIFFPPNLCCGFHQGPLCHQIPAKSIDFSKLYLFPPGICQKFRSFPARNTHIVFFAGKTTPTEIKNAFFGKCFLPKKDPLAETNSFWTDGDFFPGQSLKAEEMLGAFQGFQRQQWEKDRLFRKEGVSKVGQKKGERLL